MCQSVCVCAHASARHDARSVGAPLRSIRTSMHAHMHVYVCIHACTRMRANEYVLTNFVHMYSERDPERTGAVMMLGRKYMYVCMYVCVHVCVCVCVCVHIHRDAERACAVPTLGRKSRG